MRLTAVSQTKQLLQILEKLPVQEGNDLQNRLKKPLCLATPVGSLTAIQHLAGVSSDVAVEHAHSPFGVLELRSDGCTGCLVCVERCPTGALASERRGDELTITYEASCCIGCGICAESCPEHAAHVLRVNRVTSLGTLSRGRVVLYRDRSAICEICKTAIGSRSLIQRLETLVARGNVTLSTPINRYCPACRSSFASGARPAPSHGRRESNL